MWVVITKDKYNSSADLYDSYEEAVAEYRSYKEDSAFLALHGAEVILAEIKRVKTIPKTEGNDDNKRA